jgi:serine protease SohB
VLKARFGDKVRLRRYGPKRSLWQRFGARVAGGLVDGLVEATEERAMFARYGL